MKCNYCDEIHIGFVEVFQNRFIYFCDEHKNNIEKTIKSLWLLGVFISLWFTIWTIIAVHYLAAKILNEKTKILNETCKTGGTLYKETNRIKCN